jgi:endonuclease YncB( thermonuclease family)
MRSARKITALRRFLPLVLAAVLALVAVMAGGELTSPLPARVRAEFGHCHEGGGTNCVVDGDTLWIAGRKVRLTGIDAPETHEPRCPREAALGKAATLRLHQLVNSGTLRITFGKRDQDANGRLLRNLAVNGRDIGHLLVEAGLARRYGGAKRSWC